MFLVPMVFLAAAPAQACPICPQTSGLDFSSFGARLSSLETRVSILESRAGVQGYAPMPYLSGSYQSYQAPTTYSACSINAGWSAPNFIQQSFPAPQVSYPLPSFSVPTYNPQVYSYPQSYGQSYAANFNYRSVSTPSFQASGYGSSCPGGVCYGGGLGGGISRSRSVNKWW
jgi:hypothetical protein